MGVFALGGRDDDGAVCVDAMEHVCPEDWPGTLWRVRDSLKPGGMLYLTVVTAEPDGLEEAYKRPRRKYVCRQK
jgi:cyclopropane fatty-acyl-phospholipid synthase-like methyltransferase